MSQAREPALLSLHRGIQHCRKCRLHEGRQHAVAGEGPHDAPTMLIGEAPGAREDREGRPFVGPAGAFLDTLLEAVGIARRDVYITSSVKCRPPGNRRPRVDELACCRTAWLERQIDIIRPRLLVLLGNTALQQVLGTGTHLRDIRGQPLSRDASTVLPTYHPAAGRRFPELGEQMRRDFEQIPVLLAAREERRDR